MICLTRVAAAALLALLLVFGSATADTILQQSTAIKVRVGPFMDATDAVTPETGITLGAADQAEALKADGAATVDISGATWAAVTGADGWYDLSLTASLTDTVGELVIVVQDASVALPVLVRFQVVEENVFASLYASGAAGPLSLSATLTLPGQEAPPNAPTVEEALAYPYKAFRNTKTQSSGNPATWCLYNDAGTVCDQKKTISDDGSTTTVGEVGTGP